MGAKNWLEYLQKKAQGKLQQVEEKVKQNEDPVARKKASREEARALADRTMKAIKLAKQGLDQYTRVAKKAEELKTGAAEKTVQIAETIKPIAEKVDSAAVSVGARAISAFNSARSAVAERLKSDGTPEAENTQPEAPKTDTPSSGSSLIDFLAPAVPKTETPKPQSKKPETPANP